MSTILIEICRAKPYDAEAVADAHDEAWRTAYQGIIPGAELERCIDMHTKRGSEMGRNYEHFMKEASHIENPANGRDSSYRDRIMAAIEFLASSRNSACLIEKLRSLVAAAGPMWRRVGLAGPLAQPGFCYRCFSNGGPLAPDRVASATISGSLLGGSAGRLFQRLRGSSFRRRQLRMRRPLFPRRPSFFTVGFGPRGMT